MKTKAEKIREIANQLQKSHSNDMWVFVDLPNGHKGMVLLQILDFGIKTGNKAPDKIIKATYEIDEEIDEMGFREMARR